ncbi:uncharacterized protein LOC134831295 isoform X2 [Culicoides brevitarsis]|uniref:uncharacterized protein LOC134831295 isoform X2 n=1 Tax=Culicoides brevitarsis TaxID=469753 RepID=UPI00307C3C24
MEQNEDDTVMNESLNDEASSNNVDETKDQINVRSRVEQVKSKFVGIVNEIRKSSPPLVVRRWVDAASSTEATNANVETVKDTVEESEETFTHDDPKNHVEEIDEEPSSNRTRIASSFTSILTKLNLKAFEKVVESEVEPSVSQGSNIKNTFSDFYEKFNNNRDRYQSIKARKMDIKRMLSRTKMSEEITIDPIVVKDEEIQADEVKDISEKTSENEKFILTSEDTNIDWSLKPPSDPSHRPHRTNMRKLGRCASENQPVSRKGALSHVGRSFSVAEPENDEIVESSSNIFVTIHEGDHVSCPSLQASAQSLNAFSNASSLNLLPISPAHTTSENGLSPRKRLQHEGSFQSDSSYCSSVDSLLDARKPDPEAILRACGFGPPRQEDVISKIPKRFLKPSQVRGIDTIEFLKRQRYANQIHDSTAFGYRGLVDYEKLQILQRFERRPKSGPK